MSIPVIAFFNNKGGVGKTSLVYHLAWMYADLGIPILTADLDPQANLTAAFLNEDDLEDLWLEELHTRTIFGCIQPLLTGIGDIANPQPNQIDSQLSLLAGDLALSNFEDELSDVWPKCLDGNERAFRVISSFWRILQKGAIQHRAKIILVDLGPNLGAINRAALIASDYVVVPLSPDLFSLQGLRNLGPRLRQWRKEWKERLAKKPATPQLKLPTGKMLPIGYIVLQHSVRLDRPVRAYDRWMARIPEVYYTAVMDESGKRTISIADDPGCLTLLKHYRSLMPLAQEAHKPMFHLKPADGAIGSHFQAVQSVYQDFKRLAQEIFNRVRVSQNS
jgi:cellulose biosynthesis protein BcsQ